MRPTWESRVGFVHGRPWGVSFSSPRCVRSRWWFRMYSDNNHFRWCSLRGMMWSNKSRRQLPTHLSLAKIENAPFTEQIANSHDLSLRSNEVQMHIRASAKRGRAYQTALLGWFCGNYWNHARSEFRQITTLDSICTTDWNCNFIPIWLILH